MKLKEKSLKLDREKPIYQKAQKIFHKQDDEVTKRRDECVKYVKTHKLLFT